MTDKKLTDNEITNEYKMYTPEECLQKIVDQHKEINRLQAENEQKDKNYIELLKTSSERAVIIGEQGAENERLKNILICFMEALGKVRNVDDIDSISLIPLMSELNKGIRAEIKAEAYKELLNFLETRLVCKSKISSIGYESAIIDIKNHLKELEGD